MPARSWKSFFYSTLFLIGLLGAVGFMTLACARAYYQRLGVERDIAELKENKQRLEAKKFETAELLKYVQSTDFIEEQARTELNMVKRGEQVVVITQPTSSAGQMVENVVHESEVSNPVKWWRYFFKK